MNPRESIRQSLQQHGFQQSLVRLRQLEEQLHELQSRIQQESSQISTLDRLNVFTDSPQEARVKKWTKELKACRQELDTIAAGWNQALAALEQQFPEFARVRSVESLVGAVVDFLYGRTASPLEQVVAARAKLHPEASAKGALGQRLLAQGSPPPLESGEPFLAWLKQAMVGLSQDPDWAQAVALARVEVLLRCPFRVEQHRLDEGGQLLADSAWTGGAACLEALERLLESLTNASPEVPLGAEVRGWFLPGEARTPLETPEPWRIFGQQVLEQAQLVLALESLLGVAGSQVRWLDRVNVFTDSPEETREKQLRQLLSEQVQKLAHFQPPPEQDAASLAANVASYVGSLARAAQRVATQTGTSSRQLDCQLYHQRELSEKMEHFRRWLASAWSAPPTVRQLVEELERGGEQGLVPYVRSRLDRQTFSDLLQAARQRRAEALQSFRSRSQAAAQVSLLDRINIFTESASERAAKQAKADWKAADVAARDAEDRFESYLFQALREFPLAHLFYASEELSMLVPALQAVCRSRTKTYRRDGRNYTKTTYYCEVEGLSLVKAELQGLARLAASCGCRRGLGYRYLERRAEQVRHPALASLLPAPSGDAGLHPGEVRFRVSREDSISAGWAEDLFLDWCLQNGTGPASPGRF